MAELPRETTLGYDHGQLLGEVRAWPDVRVCQEAGPTGFGLHRALLAAAVDSVVVAPCAAAARRCVRVVIAGRPPFAAAAAALCWS